MKIDSGAICFIAASGAGAGLQQKLWEVPGASRYFAGARFPYAKEEMQALLGFMPEKFVSRETAIDMAIAAYILAVRSCHDKTQYAVGLGVTAAAPTTRELRGGCRVHIAAISKYGVRGIETTLDSEDRVSAGQDVDYLGEAVLTAAAEGLDQYKGITDDMVRQSLFARPYFTRMGERLHIPQRSVSLFPGAFNPVHNGHLHNCTEGAILQITAASPHKDPISTHELLDRIGWIDRRRDVLLLDQQGKTYLEKARLFPNSTIFMGPDALQRMLDPQWGHNTIALLQEMQNLNMKFVVTNRDGMPTLDDILNTVPHEFRCMFYEWPKNEYSGLSSTQIRDFGMVHARRLINS